MYKNQKEKRKIKKKKKKNSVGIYRNELCNTYIQHDMKYGDFKDLPKRTGCDKALLDKTFDFAQDPKYDGYQCRFASFQFIL